MNLDEKPATASHGDVNKPSRQPPPVHAVVPQDLLEKHPPNGSGPGTARLPEKHPLAETHKSHRWIWLIILAIIGAGAYWWMTRPSTATTEGTGGGRGGRGGGGPIPVVVAKSKQGNMPVYLSEQGTVVPLNTVTVRSRVDGQIEKVAFTEGQMVKEGDLLVQIDPRPFQVQLAQAQGQLGKDQASLNNAIADLNRYKSAGTAVPEQQITTQESLVEVDKAALEVDKAAIQSAELNLTYSKITAPITGRIGLRNVDVGNIIHATDTNGIAVITQLQPITVVFALPQFNIPAVMKRLSQSPPPQVDAFDVYDTALKAPVATGTLTAVDTEVDPLSGTVKLKATFPNNDNHLFPNQFVTARLLVDTLQNVVLVPDDAVQRGPDEKTFVYVVGPDQTVKVQNVTIGQNEGGQTVASQGLNAGETVVTEGVDKLQDGSKVSLRSSASSRPSTRASAGATTRNSSGESARPHHGKQH